MTQGRVPRRRTGQGDLTDRQVLRPVPSGGMITTVG